VLSIAIALLTALQPSTPAQPALTGQPCTAPELIGTWQIISKPATPGITKALKHVTPTHFFVVRFKADDSVHSGHGGQYTFADGTYKETIEHGIGEGWVDKYKGLSIPWQCRLNGDVWTIAGELGDLKRTEQWKRLTGTSAP
jgi:hypothetical protein